MLTAPADSKHPFPTPCPPQSSWIVVDNDFLPMNLWQSETARCIKRAEKRLVIKAENFYIKAFRTGGRLRRFLRDPAQKEFVIAQKLHTHNLTAPPAAWGSCGEWSYFAAREIKGADFPTFLKTEWPRLNEMGKRTICRLFAEFLSKLAAAGIFQPDFHLNNILFDSRLNRFIIIDLHRAEIMDRQLNPDAIIRQLAFCVPPFLDIISSRRMMECASFLKKNLPRLSSRSTRFHIIDVSYSNMRKHWDKRGVRKLRSTWTCGNDNGFRFISTDSCPKDVTELLAKFSHRPQEVIKQGSIIKNSRHTLCLDINCGSGRYFIKAYRSSGYLKSLSYLLRKPKALKQWHISWMVYLRNIPVITPVAVMQGRNPWANFYGLLAYPWSAEAAAGTTQKKLKNIFTDREGGQLVLKNIAFEIWRMHQKGVFHGDCKITNFVMESSGRLKAVFDLDSASINRETGDRQREKDLVCMCASLEKLQGTHPNSRSPVSTVLISYYISFHYPWTAARDVMISKLKSAVAEKIKKSQNRKAYFQDTST